MVALQFHTGSFPNNVQRAIKFLKDKIGEEGCIVLFGSRTASTKKKNPDYDIGVMTDKEVEMKTLNSWKSKVEDLAWPYRIDLVDLNRAPVNSLYLIEKEMVVLHGKYHEREKIKH